MEHTKKMALITPEALQRLRQTPVYNDITTHLDADMSKVLRSNLSDHDKWARYQETLQRYLHFKKQDREPINIPIMQTVDMKENRDVLVDDSLVLNNIPKSYRRNADILLQRLKTDKRITWDNTGVVSINNNLLANSNISDLIGDVVRHRKNSSPSGWREFTAVLKNLNIPDRVIGNYRRRQYIVNRHNTPTTSRMSRATPSRRRVLESEDEENIYDANTEAAAPKLVEWKRFSF